MFTKKDFSGVFSCDRLAAKVCDALNSALSDGLTPDFSTLAAECNQCWARSVSDYSVMWDDSRIKDRLKKAGIWDKFQKALNVYPMVDPDEGNWE